MSLRDRVARAAQELFRPAQQLAPLEPSEPPRLPGPNKRPMALQRNPWDGHSSHPEVNLKPTKIVQVYRRAELGYPDQQAELFQGVIERDSHLRHCWETRIGAVSGKEWLVQPGGDDQPDIDAAKMLQDALRDVDSFEDMLEHQLWGNAYGYSFSEIMWSRLDGVVVPRHFINVPHRRFRFDDFDRPRLLTVNNNVDGIELEPGSWIGYCRTGDKVVRQGLMRSAVWMSFFKTTVTKDWMILSERFGLPFVHGIYDDTTSDTDKEALAQAIRDIGTEGAAMLHESCKLVMTEIERGGGRADIQPQIADFCNKEISKLITGATLTSDTGAAGSYAQANVHADVRFDLVQHDAHRLQKRFSSDIARPWVLFNGLKCKIPRLKIGTVRTSSPTDQIRIAETAQKIGLEISARQLREEFGLKAPLNDEDALTLAEAQAAARPQAPAADAPPNS